MADFTYLAVNSEGKSVSGQMTSETASEAIVQLESQGLVVESIQKVNLNDAAQASDIASETRATSTVHPRTLESQFDTVLVRKPLLLPALSALAGEVPTGQGRAELNRLIGVLKDAETSTDLRSSKVVTQWLPLLVSGFGEEARTKRLSDMISRTSREADNRSQRRRMLAYPLILFLIALFVVFALCVLVVPTYGNMLADFGLTIPASTRVVLQISNHPVQFAASIFLASVAFYAFVRVWTQFALTTRLFGSAVAGNSASVSAMSSFTGHLADFLEIDVSLPDALWLAGQTCRHHFFRDAAERLARDAHRSSQPLSESPVAHSFPGNVIFALESDPHSAPSISLLRSLSQIYGDRVHRRVDWSTGALAQIAIVFIGILVGFVVFAVFAPLTSLVTGLS